jgi:hypothetical protein
VTGRDQYSTLDSDRGCMFARLSAQKPLHCVSASR